MQNHISKHVDHNVTLGQAGYGSTLTITKSGAIVPAYSMQPQPGADGIDIAASVTNARIVNDGSVVGGLGPLGVGSNPGYAGGVGVNFSSAGYLDNQGSITGGAASYAEYHVGANGGNGVQLGIGVVLANTGLVSGGAGGGAYDYGTGNGGAGVLGAGGDQVSNTGTILGGAAGSNGGIEGFYTKGTFGVGGTGVQLGDASRLTNTGLIQGGVGGGHANDTGGIGVDLGGSSALVNNGTIAGGTGGGSNYGNYYVNPAAGGAGVRIDGTGTVTNMGQILGGQEGSGYGEVSGQPGAVGVEVGAGTLHNASGIVGGSGYRGVAGYSAPGGAGVTLDGGHVANSGTITGGVGYAGAYSAGGAGLAQASGVAVNTGLIIGGVGGDFGYSRPRVAGASAGGAGVLLDGGRLSNAGTISGGLGGYAIGNLETGGAGGIGGAISGALLTNAGLIQGGTGGIGLINGYDSTFASSGIGGVGVALGSAARLVSSGTILGGAGGGGQYGGNGGAGAYLNGGTLVTSGTISGGQGGQGQDTDGSMGDAVQFGTLASTLIVDPGAVFNGSIVADAAAGDTLTLAGTSAGSLSGLGRSITGFRTIAEDSHANWSLTGSISGTGSVSIGTGAALTLNGQVSIATIAFTSGGDEALALSAPREVTTTFSGFGTGDSINLNDFQISGLKYANGTLTLNDSSATLTLYFAGSLTQANFGFKPESTKLVYKPASAESRYLSSIPLASDVRLADGFDWIGHAHVL